MKAALSLTLSGAGKPYILTEHLRQAISHNYGLTLHQAQDMATTFRSVWKPEHCYGGLLYRKKESVVVITPQTGETIVQLTNIFIADVAGEQQVLLAAQEYDNVGCSNFGGQLVRSTTNSIIAPLNSISRKVMLAKYNDNCQPTLLVVDFMRRIFL